MNIRCVVSRCCVHLKIVFFQISWPKLGKIPSKFADFQRNFLFFFKSKIFENKFKQVDQWVENLFYVLNSRLRMVLFVPYHFVIIEWLRLFLKKIIFLGGILPIGTSKSSWSEIPQQKTLQTGSKQLYDCAWCLLNIRRVVLRCCEHF